MRQQSGVTRATQLGVELDDVRQRIEPWYTDNRIECKMCTVSRAGCVSTAGRVVDTSTGSAVRPRD